MPVHAKHWSRTTTEDLAFLQRMENAALPVHAKLWSRDTAEDLAFLKRMENAATTVHATLGQRCAAARPVTKGALVSDLSGTWATQWYLREPERDLMCTYLANVLLPTQTAFLASLHHDRLLLVSRTPSKHSSYSHHSKRFSVSKRFSPASALPTSAFSPTSAFRPAAATCGLDSCLLTVISHPQTRCVKSGVLTCLNIRLVLLDRPWRS